jgi:hypothetical protein
MYLFNVIILLLNSQIQYKSLKKINTHNSHNILFTSIDDIDYGDYGDDIASLPMPINNDNNNDNYNFNSFISVNSFHGKHYKKLDGYDQRYDNTIDEFINHKLLLNKIDGFFTNKKLLDRLLKLVKQRNETTLEEGPNNNSTVYHQHQHQYESDIFAQIRQYNNDNRNKSELTYDIFAGGLLNDW